MQNDNFLKIENVDLSNLIQVKVSVILNKPNRNNMINIASTFRKAVMKKFNEKEPIGVTKSKQPEMTSLKIRGMTSILVLNPIDLLGYIYAIDLDKEIAYVDAVNLTVENVNILTNSVFVHRGLGSINHVEDCGNMVDIDTIIAFDVLYE